MLKKWEISWQRQFKNKWLANLLANKQVVSPLLDYLMATNIGNSRKKRKMEKKWIKEKIKKVKNH